MATPFKPVILPQTSTSAIQRQDSPASIEPKSHIPSRSAEGEETELFRSCQAWLRLVDNIVIELHDAKAEKTFHGAIAGLGFVISRCDELTVCLT
jgi:hypothetical protein